MTERIEETIVFSFVDERERKRFIKEIFERHPFGGDGATQIIAMATGDAMSVSDAIRMALLCDALHESTEREEFALEMCNCNNWDDCLTLAKEWELQHEDGRFIDARAAIAMETRRAETTGSVAKP